MDNSIINDFRDCVNAHGTVYQMYKNQNNKNQWGIICSAMDWISVSIEGISFKSLELNNTNRASIKIMTFIMCIDLLWEAIQQFIY